MDIKYYHFKHYEDERNIASLPWAKAHKRRKAGLITSLDYATVPTCDNRSSYKLRSIDRDGRSPVENEAWNKIIEHSATQARVRAVQMHLNSITTLSALPFSLRCCEKSRLPAMSAARAPHTDEIEREWIYDTGAAQCMIGWNFLTDDEKLRTFKTTPQSFVTAGGKTTSSTAVMCHVPFLGPRQCRVLTDCPPAISVRSEVMNYGVVFSYTRESGPSIALPDGTKVYLDD